MKRYIEQLKGGAKLIERRFNDLISLDYNLIEDTVENKCYNTDEIVELLNQQNTLIQDLLWQIEDVGYNSKECKGCASYIKNVEYCTMYDMDVKEEEIVLRCEDRSEI